MSNVLAAPKSITRSSNLNCAGGAEFNPLRCAGDADHTFNQGTKIGVLRSQ